MSKYDDMKEFYEKRIASLEKTADHWRDRVIDDAYKCSALNAKCDLYESILNKLLGEGNTRTDATVIFEGKVYRTRSFSLERNPDEPDTLTVECVRVDI